MCRVTQESNKKPACPWAHFLQLIRASLCGWRRGPRDEDHERAGKETPARLTMGRAVQANMEGWSHWS